MRGVDEDLLSIGQFGRLSGLSVGALRHYTELDLLRPAEVDRFTGYRRYRREQLDSARTIARLRDLELRIGRAEPALWHARRCVEIHEAARDREAWDLPAAYEAMARALLVGGDRTTAREWAAKARAALADVPDADDREVIEGDLASLDLD